jgi:hypothetical protein
MFGKAPDPDNAAIAESELPPGLHGSVQRHRQHLAELVVSLRAAGVDEAMIDTSVRDLVASYGNELAAAIRALVRERPDA